MVTVISRGQVVLGIECPRLLTGYYLTDPSHGQSVGNRLSFTPSSTWLSSVRVKEPGWKKSEEREVPDIPFMDVNVKC